MDTILNFDNVDLFADIVYPEKNSLAENFENLTKCDYVAISTRPKKKLGGKSYGYSRWLYLKTYGTKSLTENEKVRHICGNDHCIKIEHLVSGSHIENERDKKLHGTSANPNVTVETVKLMYKLRDEGKYHSTIAARIGCSRSLVGACLNGTYYPEVFKEHYGY